MLYVAHAIPQQNVLFEIMCDCMVRNCDELAGSGCCWRMILSQASQETISTTEGCNNFHYS